MNQREQGLLASYNSLLDEHLVGYYSNIARRRHLRKAGLITRNGVIVDEATYRLQMARKDQKKHVRNQLAAEIVHKALDMERMRRYQIEKELEQKYKVQLVKEFKNQGYHAHPKGGILQLPPAKPKHSSPSEDKGFFPQLKPRTKSTLMSPKATSTTSSNSSRVEAKTKHIRKVKSAHTHTVAHKIQLQSLAEVTVKYTGSALHKSPARRSLLLQGQEVMVIQQHCGGNTLCVFKEIITPNTIFTFISRRHRGLPFGVAFYIDGILDCRLSCCCEYRYKPGYILGGKSGHFMYVSVSGAAPCYKCQAAATVANSNSKVLSNSAAETATSDSDEAEAIKSFDIIVTVSSKEPMEKQSHESRQNSTAAEEIGQSKASKSNSEGNQDGYNTEDFEATSNTSSSDSHSDIDETTDADQKNSEAETYSISENMSVASKESSEDTTVSPSPFQEDLLGNQELPKASSADDSHSSLADEPADDHVTPYLIHKDRTPSALRSFSSSSSASSQEDAESSNLANSQLHADIGQDLANNVIEQIRVSLLGELQTSTDANQDGQNGT